MTKLTKEALSGGFDDWETPDSVYGALNAKYSFTLDPCATADNFKHANYFSPEDNGLERPWTYEDDFMGPQPERVFVNPPYSQVEKWIDKGISEMKNNKALSVFLVPARTDTKWFAKAVKSASRIVFVSGRIKFLKDGVSCKSPPFPSAIIVFGEQNNYLDQRGVEIRFIDRKTLEHGGKW